MFCLNFGEDYYTNLEGECTVCNRIIDNSVENYNEFKECNERLQIGL